METESGENGDYLLQEAAGRVENTPLELNTQYGRLFASEIQNADPDVITHKTEILNMLNEVDRQATSNFHTSESQIYPGTALSYIKFEITPEVIERVFKKPGALLHSDDTPEEEDDKVSEKASPEKVNDEKWFMFSAFDYPPRGNAFQSLDIAYDRFFRLLPKVARRMRRGEDVPKIEIYALGSGTGRGETVSKEFVDGVKNEGYDTKGKVYAEFVEKFGPKENEVNNTHLVLQGVSMGTASVNSLIKYLPQSLAEASQKLLDNPAGVHGKSSFIKRVGKSIQAGLGLVAEDFTRKRGGDNTMKVVKEGDEHLDKYMVEVMHLPENTPEQQELKSNLSKWTGIALLKGQPLHSDEERYYIRKGYRDPITFSPGRVMQIKREIGRPISTHSQERSSDLGEDLYHKDNGSNTEELITTPEQAKQRFVVNDQGRSIEVANDNAHFFVTTKSYPRWNQIAEYGINTFAK